ncbi:MAG: hypothetical protein ACREKN_03960 [Longimicrobiaceae bacterium]
MRRAPTAAVILFVALAPSGLLAQAVANALAAALNQKHGLSIPAG